MPTLPTALESYYLDLVNATRAAAGVPPLTFDGELMVAADDHSAWMDATDTFSHTGASNSSPEDRIAAAGYEATGTGENIAFFYGSDTVLNTAAVDQLHQMLVNSPTHYQNLVNPNFQNVGIGLVESDYQGNPAVFVTQNFGTPTADEATEGIASIDPNTLYIPWDDPIALPLFDFV